MKLDPGSQIFFLFEFSILELDVCLTLFLDLDLKYLISIYYLLV